MHRVLIDTDTLSEIQRGKNHKVLSKARQYEQIFGLFTISIFTVTEVVKGYEKAGNPAKIEEFMASLESYEILYFDIESATIAGRIYAGLERTAQKIGRCDPLIASIAITHSLPLATGNTRHYERIQNLGFDLILENWKE